MMKRNKMLLLKCQDINTLALHCVINSEFKPVMSNLTNDPMDDLILRLDADIKALNHIIGMQMKFDESSI